MYLIGLLIGVTVLALSVLGTLILTPALAAAVLFRKPRIAAGLALPWLASLPCSLFVVAYANIYGDPAWRDLPELESAYVGEDVSLELGVDGRFRGDIDGSSVEGEWSQVPADRFGHTARTIHLVSEDVERVAVMRWDGQLGLEGQLLSATD